MANIRGKSAFTDKKGSSSLAFEGFVPPSAWTEDATCHYLLVDLPGFKRDEVKLQVDNHTHITVSGERQVIENKYKWFEQTFELPKNADAGKITGKIEEEILHITVPKLEREDTQERTNYEFRDRGEEEKVTEEPNLDENLDKDKKKHDIGDRYGNEEERETKNRGFNEGSREDWGLEGDLLQRVIEKLRKNKGIVITTLLAFSLGVLISQRFQSNGNGQ